jgi:hypothetical protein
MSRMHLLFTALLVCCGCASQDKSNQSTPLYSESEIRAKSWVDGGPHPTCFLEWSTVDHRIRGKSGELIIVKYGDTTNNKATCLEFYERVQNPDSASQQAFALVGRDARLDPVTSVKPVVKKDAVMIEVTRETAGDETHPKRRISYVLCFSKDFTLQPALSELDFPVSE